MGNVWWRRYDRKGVIGKKLLGRYNRECMMVSV